MPRLSRQPRMSDEKCSSVMETVELCISYGTCPSTEGNRRKNPASARNVVPFRQCGRLDHIARLKGNFKKIHLWLTAPEGVTPVN